LPLSREMPIVLDRRQQLAERGSLIKNPMYIGKVQRAVGGRLGFLIIRDGLD